MPVFGNPPSGRVDAEALVSEAGDDVAQHATDLVAPLISRLTPLFEAISRADTPDSRASAHRVTHTGILDAVQQIHAAQRDDHSRKAARAAQMSKVAGAGPAVLESPGGSLGHDGGDLVGDDSATGADATVTKLAMHLLHAEIVALRSTHCGTAAVDPVGLAPLAEGDESSATPPVAPPDP